LPVGLLPSLEDLQMHKLLEAGLVSGGRRVLLPVSDRRYHILVNKDPEWVKWIEPDTKSSAYDLSLCVECILAMDVEAPDSVATMTSE
jgi:hypothetical protein